MKAKKIAALMFTAGFVLSSAAALAQKATGTGEVRKIDQDAGKITIRHGPMKALDMEDPMTMVYHVKDPAMLKTVKPGDKVKFDVEHANGQFTVIKIQKQK